MQTEFIRFQASDQVELQGWLSPQDGETAVVHVHGMGGNGYENYFLDNFREMYARLGIAFFSFDNRGRGIISDFRQGDGWKHAGSCFELFEESLYDIDGALAYLKTLGFMNFILQGHSLGCSKIVNFLVSKQPAGVIRVVLLAPTDMVAWAHADPQHQENLAKARQLLSDGKGEELVGAQCWPLDETPLSAQAYLSKSDSASAVDIYSEREDGPAPLGKVSLPTLIPYGSRDIGVTHPFGSMDVYRERLDSLKNPNIELTVIDGASHSFRGFEEELTNVVEAFVNSAR